MEKFKTAEWTTVFCRHFNVAALKSWTPILDPEAPGPSWTRPPSSLSLSSVLSGAAGATEGPRARQPGAEALIQRDRQRRRRQQAVTQWPACGSRLRGPNPDGGNTSSWRRTRGLIYVPADLIGRLECSSRRVSNFSETPRRVQQAAENGEPSSYWWSATASTVTLEAPVREKKSTLCLF